MLPYPVRSVGNSTGYLVPVPGTGTRVLRISPQICLNLVCFGRTTQILPQISVPGMFRHDYPNNAYFRGIRDIRCVSPARVSFACSASNLLRPADEHTDPTGRTNPPGGLSRNNTVSNIKWGLACFCTTSLFFIVVFFISGHQCHTMLPPICCCSGLLNPPYGLPIYHVVTL